MRYRKFREKNPTFQSRVEALTSGLITPDTKGIALWSLEPGEAYTLNGITENVCNFTGIDRKEFPFNKDTLWYYFDCFRETPGILYNIGTVARCKVKCKSRGEYNRVTAYKKTDAAIDIFDPLVARYCNLVNRWMKRPEGKRPKFFSAYKIIGGPNGPKGKMKRGWGDLLVVKLLAENPDEEFARKDIIEKTGLDDSVVFYTLNSLERAGMIEYESLFREKEGKKQGGGIKYWIKNPEGLKDLCPEEVFKKTERKLSRSRYRSYLSKTIDYINKNPGKEYGRDKTSGELGVDGSYISCCLGLLNDLGYLESRFRDRFSVARANENTVELWYELLEPIEAVSRTADPGSYPGFRDMLDNYSDKGEKLEKDVRNWLWVYQKERTNRGPVGGKKLRKTILEILPRHKNMKLSQIHEEFNERVDREMGDGAIRRHINILMEEGSIEKREGRGMYGINPDYQNP